ncbi:MAG: PilZ domain-containing protein [Tepidisphaeraceae bacterium]
MSTETADQTATSFRIDEYHLVGGMLEHDERRRHPRRFARLRAEARRLDNSVLAKRSPRLGLTILNVSEGGLAATTRSPVEEGERLAIFFPPDQPAPAGRVVGRVIRCKPCPQGWSLAMKFDLTFAA